MGEDYSGDTLRTGTSAACRVCWVEILSK